MIGFAGIEVVILAGGKSSRMGSDKGLLLLDGKPMIRHLTDTVQETGLPLRIISQNKAYERFGFPVSPDIIPGKGPMGGLLSALMTSHHEQVLLLSCDSPFITRDLLELLKAASQPGKITVPRFSGRLYPLCAVYPFSMALQILRRILKGDLKMTSLIVNAAHTIVDVDELLAIRPIVLNNINTPEELKNTEKLFAHGN